MEEYIKDTLIASPYPFWLTILLFALTTGVVQLIVSYFKEKGKNLATKEDIGNITNEIKSIESRYNSSLERLKMDLLREHELSKSIFEICNNLDKILIENLVKCKKDIAKDGSYESCGESGNALSSIIQLGDFLQSYEIRYKNLPNFGKLVKQCNEMYDVYIDTDNDYGPNETRNLDKTDYDKITQKTDNYISKILAIFLPPVKI